MFNYPAKVAVVVPNFVIVDGDNQHSVAERFVYLNAFSVLRVERAGRGFHFDEARQVDESGSAGVDLLHALSAQLDGDTSLAGLRLDRMIGSLVRVPRGGARDEACKPALERLRAALRNDVHDADVYGPHGLRQLEDLSRQYDLPAEWHQPGRQANPNMLERQLSARAQTIWLVIARALLDLAEQRRAHADYDQWRTAHAIA